MDILVFMPALGNLYEFQLIQSILLSFFKSVHIPLFFFSVGHLPKFIVFFLDLSCYIHLLCGWLFHLYFHTVYTCCFSLLYFLPDLISIILDGYWGFGVFFSKGFLHYFHVDSFTIPSVYILKCPFSFLSACFVSWLSVCPFVNFRAVIHFSQSYLSLLLILSSNKTILDLFLST